jgi:hypothetical protein
MTETKFDIDVTRDRGPGLFPQKQGQEQENHPSPQLSWIP